ncbi:hypothetical protein MTO96_015792 [Rhipicephalus appendiculatus]
MKKSPPMDHTTEVVCLYPTFGINSQSFNEKPITPWLPIKEDGVVQAAHCTCKAGVGEQCSHIAAVLFFIEAVVKKRDSQVCTDRTNAWLPPSVRFLEGKEASQVSFASSTMRKRQMGGEEPLRKRQRRRNVEKSTTEEWASFLSSCHARRCRPALLSVEKTFAKAYVLAATDFPTAVLGSLQGDDVPATWESMEAHCCRLAETLSLEKEVTPPRRIVAEEIQRETRQQSKSSKWFPFRTGRITASDAKAVCRTSVTAPSMSMVKRVCYAEATQCWPAPTSWG